MGDGVFMNVVIVSVVSVAINILLGRYRIRYRKMSVMWWILIHASIPLLVPLRIWLDTPVIAIPLFIGCAIIGQVIGSRSKFIRRTAGSSVKEKR